MATKLLELCEPVFQYVCRLNRSARKGLEIEPAQVRAEIRGILAELRAKAGSQPGLVRQWDRVELPLIFFVDFMIKESKLRWATQWEEMAHERNELAGDEKFFDLVEENLSDPSEDATQALSVFYTCIGLGFTGWYTGQPEYLRKKMMEISARLRGMMDADDAAKICPEAYEHVNTSDLVQSPGRKLVGIGVALVLLLVVVFLANATAFIQTRSEWSRDLDRIVEFRPRQAETN